jgi:integrase
MRGLPRAITPQQIEQVLAHYDHSTEVGKRDYAILLLLARLRLRTGEVVELRLEDLHWTNGEIIVRAKGASCEALLLIQEVGEAIGGILRLRHPDTTALYAKVDLSRLRTLAAPWPGGAS